jgi:hypothetical protein
MLSLLVPYYKADITELYDAIGNLGRLHSIDKVLALDLGPREPSFISSQEISEPLRFEKSLDDAISTYNRTVRAKYQEQETRGIRVYCYVEAHDEFIMTATRDTEQKVLSLEDLSNKVPYFPTEEKRLAYSGLVSEPISFEEKPKDFATHTATDLSTSNPEYQALMKKVEEFRSRNKNGVKASNGGKGPLVIYKSRKKTP